ncbi:40S ribosomal protein S20-like [Prionailurus bengalensis]|uniref:40S ribosomal protein S20-like n=1 Tax=Prionailurus bengalensis TaxID=37029 RepID=UPI001CAA373E|nr:40S ribosomal protein S20-like [Prionailurus bengalensis]
MTFKDTRKTPGEPEVASCPIRITLGVPDLLTRHNVQSLEKLCADFVRGTKEKNLKVKGQFGYLPRLKITARKTPCGKDSKTWDHFQMTIIEIMRQVIDLHSPSEIVKQITSISIEPGVETEVTIADA